MKIAIHLPRVLALILTLVLAGCRSTGSNLPPAEASARAASLPNFTEKMQLCAPDKKRPRHLEEICDQFVNTPEGRAGWILAQAYVAEREGELKTAIEYYDQALSEVPGLVVGLVGRARVYQRTFQDELAMADVTRALEIDPRNYLANLIRGTLNLDARNFPGAIDDLTAAVEADENKAAPYAHRAEAYAEIGQIKRAVADANEAVRLAPILADVYVSRASILLRALDVKQAFEDLGTARRLDPMAHVRYYKNALSYRKFGNYHVALREIDRAIHLFPAKTEYFIERGNIFLLMNRPAKAIPNLEFAVSQLPALSITKTQLAVAYYRAMRQSDGIDLMKTVLDDDPDDAQVLKTYAFLLAYAKDADRYGPEAMRMSKELVARSNTPDNRAIMGAALSSIRDVQGALKAYEDAFSASSEGLNHLTQFLRRNGFYRGADTEIFTADLRSALLDCLRTRCRPFPVNSQ